jgi:hypothetical protein
MARGRGRPRFEITPAICKKAEDLGAKGMNLRQIAQCLGIAYQTLNECRKEYDDFSDAITTGLAKGIALATTALSEQVQLGNITAIKYFLNNRAADWTESRDVNVTDNRKHAAISAVSEEIGSMLGPEEDRPPEGVITH